MLHPLQDINQITERLNGVSFFLHSENGEHVVQLKSCLKHIKDVAKILARIRTFRSSIMDWWHLFQVPF
jgi:DNA mismatch repair ATPase MutS